MKKVFCLLISIAFLLPFLLQPINAATVTEDSLSISQEVRDNLNATEEDFVVRFYIIGLIDQFGTFDTLQEIFRDGEVLQEGYIVEKPDGSRRFVDSNGYVEFSPSHTIIDGQRVEIPAITILDEAWEAFTTRTVVEMIAPDVTVDHIYYIYAENMMEGTAVYYETNYGDYVYYRSYTVGGECLFPVEVFAQYMHEYYEARRKYLYTSLLGVWDVSSFDIHSDTFDLNGSYFKVKEVKPHVTPFEYWNVIWALVGILGGSILGTALILLHRKIKEKSEYNKYG